MSNKVVVTNSQSTAESITEKQLRKNINAAYHPDAWPGASPELKRELTETVAELNGYLDKHKGQKMVNTARRK